jgi:hypothetical protein
MGYKVYSRALAGNYLSNIRRIAPCLSNLFVRLLLEGRSPTPGEFESLESLEFMSNIPIVKSRLTSYENFVAQCPYCGKDSIFNRAPDLHTFEPIAGLDVACQSDDCRKPFRIVGDSVNSAHEMLIFDCYELIENKHYMACILSLAQAYEVFFSLFFRVELLYKPFASDPDQELSDLNQLSGDLQREVGEHSFSRLRALFLSYIVTGRSPKTLADAAAVVTALSNSPRVPKDAAIESMSDAKLVSLLKALKGTSINTLRNQVVHQSGYRPTRGEVDTALEETRSILFPLTSRLKLHDEINWYLRNPNSIMES